MGNVIWICRAGKRGIDYTDFIAEEKIYLAWEKYSFDLKNFNEMEITKKMVAKENLSASKTAISTWASQIICFVNEMRIGDYVFIPSEHSKDYCLAEIIGDYCYDNSDVKYHHSRNIRIIKEYISRKVFPIYILNSMDAYRNIFKVGHQDELKEILVNYGWIK